MKYYTKEIIKEFIRNQIAKPTADPTIVRTWYGYANASGVWNLTKGHARGFTLYAKEAGKDINEEFGFDVIKMHFYGIWKNNEINNPDKPWEPTHELTTN